MRYTNKHTVTIYIFYFYIRFYPKQLLIRAIKYKLKQILYYIYLYYYLLIFSYLRRIEKSSILLLNGQDASKTCDFILFFKVINQVIIGQNIK